MVYTALGLAIAKRLCISVVRDLVDLGADVNTGYPPIITAALYAQSDLVDFLLAHGADPDADGGYGTALHNTVCPFFRDECNGFAYADSDIATAILEKRKKIIGRLVQTGARMNVIRAFGTPLDLALGDNPLKSTCRPISSVFFAIWVSAQAKRSILKWNQRANGPATMPRPACEDFWISRITTRGIEKSTRSLIQILQKWIKLSFNVTFGSVSRWCYFSIYPKCSQVSQSVSVCLAIPFSEWFK